MILINRGRYQNILEGQMIKDKLSLVNHCYQNFLNLVGKAPKIKMKPLVCVKNVLLINDKISLINHCHKIF